MWTFDNPPKDMLKQRYNFEPTNEWLDKVRLSAVRFMDGGSGSLVSPYGLVITNHHVALGQLQKLSSAGRDIVKDGFLALELSDEIKCPDLEVNILVSMEDVTTTMQAVIKPGMDPKTAHKARIARKARIEKDSLRKTGLRSDVVSLYKGGEYWLYRYKKYTDIRLVMSPEFQAAFFGGDDDNFTYPRYALDMTFFRIYEDGKPLRNKHYLQFNPKGAKRGELVFIVGNPGRTNRLDTVSQLKITRDVTLPSQLEYIDAVDEALVQYSRLGQEQNRRAQVMQFGLANAKKAISGMYSGLRNPALFQQRSSAEQTLRDAVAADLVLKKKYASAWDQIEKVTDQNTDQIQKIQYHNVRFSQLATHAVNLVKYVQETTKPDAVRLNGFHEAQLPSTRFRLLSKAPIYPDLEKVVLETSLRISIEKIGTDNRYARLIQTYGGPHKAAQHLISHTKLMDPSVRQSYLEQGREAIEASEDAMIVFARKLVPILRDNEMWMKNKIESVVVPAAEKIAQARFAVHGKNAYPDATFTLRMTFGPVQGYPMNGTRAPHQTNLYGLFERALAFGNQGPWTLPKRYWQRKDRLTLSTPVNFVSVCDIIGGNSGSPVINRQAQLVGVVFDGNIESLSNRFAFDETSSRAVSVHSAYILEALRKLYDAHDLADELSSI